MNIFITGAESTGKSTLAAQLSRHFGLDHLPEFAREYISSLNRPYTFEDLDTIAKRQISDIEANNAKDLVVFDTGLIITYVWYDVKYGKVPDWLEKSIGVHAEGKYLICEPDIPWIDDAVRENPFLREELDRKYKELISHFNFDFALISGDGEKRLSKAIIAVENWLIKKHKK